MAVATHSPPSAAGEPACARFWLSFAAVTKIEAAAVTAHDAAGLLAGLARHDGATEFKPGGLDLISVALSEAAKAIDAALPGQGGGAA